MNVTVEEATYRNHSMANNKATASAGIPSDVRIIMIVTILALGTDGIAIEAIVVNRLKQCKQKHMKQKHKLQVTLDISNTDISKYLFISKKLVRTYFVF